MTFANGTEHVRERIRALPQLLRRQLETPLPDLPPDLRTKGVIATGVGSSEAAARYLVFLLNRIGIPAEFLPLSFFYTGVRLTRETSPYLAVFSQGLSPNSGIVLKQRHRFSGTLLFTSSTREGQLAAGKTDRADLLDTLESEAAAVFVHPMQNEYEILPRFVGPVCAFMEGCKLIESLAPESLGGPSALALIPDCLENYTIEKKLASDCLGDLSGGIRFIFTHAGSQYAQNLPCKFMETLFIDPPQILDILTYSHGPFQLDHQIPASNWIFTTTDPVEQKLFEKTAPLFSKVGTYREISSDLPRPMEIFHYESFLNQLILTALEASEVDLVNWPGKGQDDEGYTIHSPGV